MNDVAIFVFGSVVTLLCAAAVGIRLYGAARPNTATPANNPRSEKGNRSDMNAPVRSALVALAAAALAVAAPARAGEKKDIIDTAVSAGNFRTLATAIQAAGLADTLKGNGPFTVFAPTDAAFAKLPKGTVEKLVQPENKAKLTQILLYHVVPGRAAASDVMKLSTAKTAGGAYLFFDTTKGVRVNDATVTKADIEASNGIIHVVDSVILPLDAVDFAVRAGKFTTLVTAVKAAGLAQTLKGDGPFTIFAPTDAAFEKLPAGALEALVADPEKLKSVLLFHVVSGKVLAKDVAGMESATTLQGGRLEFSTDEGVRVNGAHVVAPDQVVSNGVIHVIDAILLPE